MPNGRTMRALSTTVPLVHIAKLWAEAAPAESPHESTPSESRSSNSPAMTGPRICLLSLFTKTAPQDRRKAHPSRQARPPTHAIRSAPDLIGGVRCARYRGVRSTVFITGNACVVGRNDRASRRALDETAQGRSTREDREASRQERRGGSSSRSASLRLAPLAA
jgi:hypothetical protein